MPNQTHQITSFYRFFANPPELLSLRKAELEQLAQKLELRGLIIIAEEGCNGTVSASASMDGIFNFKNSLNKIFSLPDSPPDNPSKNEWMFKDSISEKTPFPRFRVKIRPEIVTIRSGVNASPNQSEHGNDRPSYLSPEQWQQVLENENDFVLLDTRNYYETELGLFAGAVDPSIKHFQQFPDFVKNCDIPKDKKVLMYCTGGIRCEKAIIEMEQQGYSNVFQLKGGILAYLEKYPQGHFQGECFVFDNRVSLDQNLAPSKVWHLCPHCGQPGKEKINCGFCQQETHICTNCMQKPEFNTCSHDCAYKIVHHPSRQRQQGKSDNLSPTSSS